MAKEWAVIVLTASNDMENAERSPRLNMKPKREAVDVVWKALMGTVGRLQKIKFQSEAGKYGEVLMEANIKTCY